MNAQPGAIKKGRKFDQMLEGARKVFMADGFEGANVDEIARVAKVSKATIYSYVPDKRLLFMEVAKLECRRQADAAIARMQLAGPASAVLFEAASHMVRFFLSDFGRQTYRIAVAESERFPEIGRAFYNSGPTIARTALTAYLADRISNNELVVDDIELAADQFIELCKASLHTKMMMGVKTEFTDAEVDRVIRGAVDTFLARYGT
ncbi:MAG: TetR/AcrR family transcriptional regulator [Rhodobacter sp.]|jgi:AcrR family transcriptional regulator|nr:TetR/AcrR family transcriptional regulator [Rhodobacter sp.]